MNKNKVVMALGLSVSVSLLGCGGGSSSSSGGSSSSSYSVTAIDGYLQNAQVWLDLNKNFIWDTGEPKATTGAGGKATLDVTGIDNPESYPIVVKAIKGKTVDEDTGNTIATDYVMSAPAGEQDITPLSTMVHVLLERDANLSKEDAVQTVATQLGITSDEVLGDYIEDNDVEAAFGAKTLVSSGVLPETPEELASEADEETTTTSTFLTEAQTVNTETKDHIETEKSALGEGEELNLNDKVGTFDPETGEVTFEEDSDGDGVANSQDWAPDNSEEWLDSDGDTIGDNADTDDDNDGTLDTDDDFPFNPNETKDTDEDGIGNNADTDDDNDGTLDTDDAFPLDPEETLDTDKDGIGNNADTDDDNDGALDGDDAFPLNPEETTDTDKDGIGNNADTDDDNDGILDVDDSNPTVPDLNPIEQVIQFMQNNSMFYALWADHEYNDATGTESVEIYVEKFTLSNNIGTVTEAYQMLPDGRKVADEPDANDEDDIVLGPDGWQTFNDTYAIAINSDAVSVYPEEVPSLTNTAYGYVKDLSGLNMAEHSGELGDYVDADAVFPEGAEGGIVKLTADVDQYFLWFKPWFWRASGNTSDDGHNATNLTEIQVAPADISQTGDDVHTAKGISIGMHVGVQFVTDGTTRFMTLDWWNESTQQPGTVTINGTGTWSQVVVNGVTIIRYSVPDSVVEAWGDVWDNDSQQLILSVYGGIVHSGDYLLAGQSEDDDEGYLLNETAKEALLGAINLPGWCPITEVASGATLADFQAQIADCQLPVMDPEGAVLYRVNSSGETRVQAYAANNEALRFKNGTPSTKYWMVNQEGTLEFGDDAQNIWDYKRAIMDVDEDGILSMATFDPETGEISLGLYQEVDLSQPFTYCETSNSDWDEVNEVPTTFFSFDTYADALKGCVDDTAYRAAKFTSTFIGEQLVMKDEDGTITFLANKTGTFVSTDENIQFTWTEHDAENGIIALSYSFVDDNQVTQNNTTYMGFAYSNGIQFNVKGFTVSTEWNGNTIDSQGEIWDGLFIHPESEQALIDYGFIEAPTP
ncbi:thrombospondin type 3 repeat-containing protein [Vibrio vulnificus]|nr:hypothetical protein [Vibrio vulnificus]EHH1189031.1 hypothetical protein [Vibrio vulnificus]EIA1303284.1 thrombospondin type 3 repeat-containing protein [Vibrio vulnificus]